MCLLSYSLQDYSSSCSWCLPPGRWGWSKSLVQASCWEGLMPAHWWVVGLVPLVGRAMSNGVFIGSCGLRKTLSSLNVCWRVGLHSYPVGCLAWGIPTLWVAFGLLGRARSWHQNGGLQDSLHQWVLPSTSLTSVLVHTVSHSHLASPGHSPRSAGRSCPGSYEVTAFSTGSQCTWNLVCALQEWHFCFPQFCGVSAMKPLWPSKPNALGAPPPNSRSPYWGAWPGAQNSHFCGRTSAI